MLSPIETRPKTERSPVGTGVMAGFLWRHRTGALVAAITLVADQAAKIWIMRTFVVGESWPEVGLFQLTHVVNTGSAFGFFGGHNLALVVASAVGLSALFALYWPHQKKPGVRAQLSFGLMFAGAIGNLLDRVFVGHVTDFIDVIPWFIFNLADVSIVTGVVIFACVVPTAGRRDSRLSRAHC